MTDQRKDYQKNWQLLAEGQRQGLYNCFHEFYDDLYRFGVARYKDKELAREAIQEIDRLVREGVPDAPRKIGLPVRLIVRASTEARRK